MRFATAAKATLLAATAGLLLSACGSDTEADATATAAAEGAGDVNAIAVDINTKTGCEAFGGAWTGGEVADAAAVSVYTCDADGDGAVETTLSIYATADEAAADVANVEAAADDTAVLQGDTYVVATTDSSHFASVNADGVVVVRELPVAE